MKKAALTIATFALGATAAGCSGAGTSNESDSADPIVVGAISTLTGRGSFPESGAAAKAYFDDLNTRGGIKGRKVEYTVLDDAATGSRSAQNARQLVDREGAVALVGSASTLDCATNARFYEQRKVVSVPGVGIQPQCYTSASIAPTNTGLFQGIGVNIVYAVETMGKKSPCTLVPTGNGAEEALERVVSVAQDRTGAKVGLRQFYPDGNSDWRAYLLKAKEAGCDVLLPAVSGPEIVSLEKQVTEFALRTSMPTVQLASAYSEEYAATLRDVADGLVANSEFLPFTGEGAQDPALADYRKLMEQAGQPLSSFGQGGYLAAKFFTEVAGGIDGEITAESVTAAFTRMQPISSPLLGNAFVFGPGKAHQPNQSSRYVKLSDGEWEPISTEWTTLSVGQ